MKTFRVWIDDRSPFEVEADDYQWADTGQLIFYAMKSEAGHEEAKEMVAVFNKWDVVKEIKLTGLKGDTAT